MLKSMLIKTKRKVYTNLTNEQISLISEICQNPQLTKEIYNCYFSLKNWNDCDNIKIQKIVDVETKKKELQSLFSLMFNKINSL